MIKLMRLLGLAAVAWTGCLAAPTGGASAASLISPGARRGGAGQCIE